MKRVLAWLTIIVFTGLYIICSHVGLLEKASEYKIHTRSVFASEKAKYGDLFGLSYLREYKERRDLDSLQVPVEKFNCGEKINLCLVHDSYLAPNFLKSKEQLGCIDTLYNIEFPWFHGRVAPPIQLDSSKTNILLFEISERSLFHLDTSNILSFARFEGDPAGNRFVANFKRARDMLFNKKINENLEFIVFDNKLLTPLKELKASINYHLFDRVAPEVIISANKKYIFYSETLSSIKNKVTDEEVERLVAAFNKAFAYYKDKGFSGVYLSIIPNTISMVDPESRSYNELIPRIQNHPDLKIPFIDIYSIFKTAPMEVYYHTDTHWNLNGYQLWLNSWNRVLASHYKPVLSE